MHGTNRPTYTPIPPRWHVELHAVARSLEASGVIPSAGAISRATGWPVGGVEELIRTCRHEGDWPYVNPFGPRGERPADERDGEGPMALDEEAAAIRDRIRAESVAGHRSTSPHVYARDRLGRLARHSAASVYCPDKDQFVPTYRSDSTLRDSH